jgi:hypothetical protein
VIAGRAISASPEADEWEKHPVAMGGLSRRRAQFRRISCNSATTEVFIIYRSLSDFKII